MQITEAWKDRDGLRFLCKSRLKRLETTQRRRISRRRQVAQRSNRLQQHIDLMKKTFHKTEMEINLFTLTRIYIISKRKQVQFKCCSLICGENAKVRIQIRLIEILFSQKQQNTTRLFTIRNPPSAQTGLICTFVEQPAYTSPSSSTVPCTSSLNNMFQYTKIRSSLLKTQR